MNYYTPSLNEFHVDFIYERLDEGGFAMSQVMQVTTSLSAIQQLLDEGSIRVKVLDEDDVESLGFRLGTPFDGIEEPYLPEGITRFSFPGSFFALLLRHEHNTAFITLYDVEQQNGPTRFVGECKNINELERILTRLSIHQPVSYASN